MSFVPITVEKNSSRVGSSLLPSPLYLVTSRPCHFLKMFPAVCIVWIFPSLDLKACIGKLCLKSDSFSF